MKCATIIVFPPYADKLSVIDIIRNPAFTHFVSRYRVAKSGRWYHTLSPVSDYMDRVKKGTLPC